MNSTRPQPAVSTAPNPASAVRRDMRAGLSADIGDLSLQIEDPVAHQPVTRILGVPGKPGRGAPESEGIAPLIHVPAHALSPDVWQCLRQNHLQVAHRTLFRIV